MSAWRSSRAVYERIAVLTEQALAALKATIERRAERGVPRDGHGDLRLDHVYLFPDRTPPSDLVIVDGIEFNERFRYADPVADMAFLAMDLAFHGRRDLAQALADAYLQASGDDEGRALLALLHVLSGGCAGQGRRDEARRAWGPRGRAGGGAGEGSGALASGPRHARGAGPATLPCAGRGAARRREVHPRPRPWLSGRALRSSARTSYARNWPAGAITRRPTASFASDIYTPQWTERTYSECLRRAEALLFEGRRVVVDATFQTEANRVRFLDLATRLGVPGVLLLCRADPSVVRARLEGAARRCL